MTPEQYQARIAELERENKNMKARLGEAEIIEYREDRDEFGCLECYVGKFCVSSTDMMGRVSNSATLRTETEFMLPASRRHGEHEARARAIAQGLWERITGKEIGS